MSHGLQQPYLWSKYSKLKTILDLQVIFLTGSLRLLKNFKFIFSLRLYVLGNPTVVAEPSLAN
jgi:hypothetical protein